MSSESKALTAVTVAKAKPRATKYKLAAGGGLYLEVMPTGAKYWRWKYRFAGKEKRLALGVYPAVSLSDARQLRDEERAKLRIGAEPVAQRKLQKLAATVGGANSFAAVAREWIERRTGKGGREVTEITLANNKWLHAVYAKPTRRCKVRVG